jgi:hypothetical protein
MLIEVRPGEFVAACDDCEERSSPVEGSREVAILRLMRTRWRVRSEGGATHTWCPTCQTMPSIPALKVAR